MTIDSTPKEIVLARKYHCDASNVVARQPEDEKGFSSLTCGRWSDPTCHRDTRLCPSYSTVPKKHWNKAKDEFLPVHILYVSDLRCKAPNSKIILGRLGQTVAGSIFFSRVLFGYIASTFLGVFLFMVTLCCLFVVVARYVSTRETGAAWLQVPREGDF